MRVVRSLCSRSGRSEFGAASWCPAGLARCSRCVRKPASDASVPASEAEALAAFATCSRAPRGRGERVQAALSAERELAWLEVTSTRIVPASIAWASARAIVCHRVQEIMWEPSSAAHNMAQTSSQLAGIAAAAGESPSVYIK